MQTGTGNSDPLLEPGEALDRLAAWKGRVDQLAVSTKSMSDQLAQLRVTAADDTKTVQVTVDAQGALVDIRFGRRIQQIEPDAVARTVMSTIRLARQQIAERAENIISETVGTDSAAGRAIAERVVHRLQDQRTGEDSDG
ncbi:YbaB/EbfC family nucleoid-associated protein [Actinoplanes friuliensis]|uniref:YbaB/EbfC DNA-binding family protein n=1 Tax=Actinoplanes friuliensis DSM 7358 TaxID=1246995 RepID=U5WEH5_9ACTN|nr:YbaB/EbfC family nucleoid-associated protein [Actinoplanes friuliensis]AGZ46445.1 hypothetical protein AFR_40955 [Actinoplanes friuliensis DSM 7358]